jgi:hypothetical protein
MRQARSAAGAILGPDDRPMPAPELVAFPDPRRKDQVQIRRIHVTVDDNGPVGQNGERGNQAGLARPAFTADDDKFLHASLSFCLIGLSFPATLLPLKEPYLFHEAIS